MRIYLSCLQSRRRHSLPAYAFWESYFKRGIEEAGHAWLEHPDADWVEVLALPESADREAWRERTWSAVYEDVRRQHLREGIDLFLGYFYPAQVDPDAIQAIRALGVPCVNFFCDNVREFRDVPQEYRAFDLHWVPERAALSMYARAGLRAVHRPMPVWIDPSLRTHEHVERHPATFIGSRDETRELLFARAIRLGAQLELRGPGWSPDTLTGRPVAEHISIPDRIRNQVLTVRRHGVSALLWKGIRQLQPEVPDDLFTPRVRSAVFGEEYARVTQQSTSIIGVNRYPSVRRPFFRPGRYSRLRDIEAPMMGACYLTEWTPELEDMYEIGREIETYRTPRELVEQISRLAADRGHRRRLRVNGQRRALAHHTVTRSLEVIGAELGATV